MAKAKKTDLKVATDDQLSTQLTELKRDRALCSRVLKLPQITATPVRESPFKDGCGWENAVRISNAGGAALSVGTVS